MSFTTNRLVLPSIVAGTFFLAITPATPSTTNAGLTIREIAIRGSEVAITVANASGRTLGGVAVVRLVTSGGEAVINAPVVVAAGETTTVVVNAPAQPQAALPVGVVLDDGVPF